MERFVWKDEYSVGVRLINEQHKRFFEIANNILAFTEGEKMNLEKLLALLGELENYAFYHLSTEEEYFYEFHYGDAALHVAVHSMFRETVKKYVDRAHAESADVKTIAGEAAWYAGNWLSAHILVMDKKYAAFFNEHGLK